MNYNYFPGKELRVSVICLGTMNFGIPVVEKDAIKLINAALDMGINFIDTANMYQGYTRYYGSPGGVAENIIGKAIIGKREKIILATKVGMKVGDEPGDEGLSRIAIEKQLNKSLERLKTDYVDIYYLHKPDPNTPIEESLDTLDRMIHKGKIRFIGISNFSARETENLLKVVKSNSLPKPIVHQPHFSLLEPEVEKDLFPLLEKEKIAAVPYQVLQGGVLTGKYQKGKPLPKDSRKAEKPDWVIELTDEIYNILEKIEKQAKDKGQSLLEYTLRETLSRPAVVSMVIGVKRLDQLKQIVEIFK